ncbi:MAG: CPBP family intramembrane metalloprotease [Candidatus Saccharicenans sp.]|jgi:membrane protease YdiL (CAAX protease family)|nr:CPBP family intramembrane metalloprotease [Candidatus Saccharicenans sp.]
MKDKPLAESHLYWLTVLSAAIFPLIFSGWLPAALDFWSLFSATLLVFLLVALWLEPGFSRLIAADFLGRGWGKVAIGVASAILLYVLFYAGSLILPKIMPGGLAQMALIYALKSGQSQWRVGIFLALIIGPGEELWWRGFLQRHWSSRLGSWPGLFLVAGLYAAVHLTSRNPVLILAALVCGLVWGYQYLKFKSILANIISHVLFDLAVFLFLPF